MDMWLLTVLWAGGGGACTLVVDFIDMIKIYGKHCYCLKIIFIFLFFLATVHNVYLFSFKLRWHFYKLLNLEYNTIPVQAHVRVCVQLLFWGWKDSMGNRFQMWKMKHPRETTEKLPVICMKATLLIKILANFLIVYGMVIKKFWK